MPQVLMSEDPAPIYNLFKKDNIDTVEHLLRIAKECGVKYTNVHLMYKQLSMQFDENGQFNP